MAKKHKPSSLASITVNISHENMLVWMNTIFQKHLDEAGVDCVTKLHFWENGSKYLKLEDMLIDFVKKEMNEDLIDGIYMQLNPDDFLKKLRLSKKDVKKNKSLDDNGNYIDD